MPKIFTNDSMRLELCVDNIVIMGTCRHMPHYTNLREVIFFIIDKVEGNDDFDINI